MYPIILNPRSLHILKTPRKGAQMHPSIPNLPMSLIFPGPLCVGFEVSSRNGWGFVGRGSWHPGLEDSRSGLLEDQMTLKRVCSSHNLPSLYLYIYIQYMFIHAYYICIYMYIMYICLIYKYLAVYVYMHMYIYIHVYMYIGAYTWP